MHLESVNPSPGPDVEAPTYGEGLLWCRKCFRTYNAKSHDMCCWRHLEHNPFTEPRRAATRSRSTTGDCSCAATGRTALT